MHGMVWHASVQDLDFCIAVYKSVLQAEFVKTILKLDKLPPNTVLIQCLNSIVSLNIIYRSKGTQP